MLSRPINTESETKNNVNEIFNNLISSAVDHNSRCCSLCLLFWERLQDHLGVYQSFSNYFASQHRYFVRKYYIEIICKHQFLFSVVVISTTFQILWLLGQCQVHSLHAPQPCGILLAECWSLQLWTLCCCSDSIFAMFPAATLTLAPEIFTHLN